MRAHTCLALFETPQADKAQAVGRIQPSDMGDQRDQLFEGIENEDSLLYNDVQTKPQQT